MMKERDTARQRVSALISERETSRLLSPSASTSAASASRENNLAASKASK